MSEKAFLQAILADPASAASTWLILADWLEEQGDPRFELVRLCHDPQFRPEWSPPERDDRVRHLLAAGVLLTHGLTARAGEENSPCPPPCPGPCTIVAPPQKVVVEVPPPNVVIQAAGPVCEKEHFFQRICHWCKPRPVAPYYVAPMAPVAPVALQPMAPIQFAEQPTNERVPHHQIMFGRFTQSKQIVQPIQVGCGFFGSGRPSVKICR